MRPTSVFRKILLLSYYINTCKGTNGIGIWTFYFSFHFNIVMHIHTHIQIYAYKLLLVAIELKFQECSFYLAVLSLSSEGMINGDKIKNRSPAVHNRTTKLRFRHLRFTPPVILLVNLAMTFCSFLRKL